MVNNMMEVSNEENAYILTTENSSGLNLTL